MEDNDIFYFSEIKETQTCNTEKNYLKHGIQKNERYNTAKEQGKWEPMPRLIPHLLLN